MQRANPAVAARDVAAALGVSRQRIYQVASRHGLRFARAPRAHLPPDIRVTGGVPALTARSLGIIGELLTATDLLGRGYLVYRPIVDHRGVDLLAIDPDDRVLRVEVKSARRVDGRLAYRRSERPVDVFALVVVGEPVMYEPADVVGRFALAGSDGALAPRSLRNTTIEPSARG